MRTKKPAKKDTYPKLLPNPTFILVASQMTVRPHSSWSQNPTTFPDCSPSPLLPASSASAKRAITVLFRFRLRPSSPPRPTASGDDEGCHGPAHRRDGRVAVHGRFRNHSDWERSGANGERLVVEPGTRSPFLESPRWNAGIRRYAR